MIILLLFQLVLKSKLILIFKMDFVCMSESFVMFECAWMCVWLLFIVVTFLWPFSSLWSIVYVPCVYPVEKEAQESNCPTLSYFGWFKLTVFDLRGSDMYTLPLERGNNSSDFPLILLKCELHWLQGIIVSRSTLFLLVLYNSNWVKPYRPTEVR